MSDPKDNGISVLVVEDEFIQALELKSTLRSLGYRVAGSVAEGEAAIAASAELRPDIVLMDINLAGEMDGIESSLAIRNHRPVPVIYVTAFSDDETLARVQESSPYGYIVKPYRERDLKICMEMALAKFQYETMLVKAKELAEENDRAKTRFLATISHELKTPLNAVIGFTELAVSMARDSEQAECLAMSMRGARRLESVIETLLDYTQLESGSLIAIPSAFRLDSLLERAVEPYRDEAEKKDLAFSVELEPGLPREARGDAGKIATILGVFADNAVKFTESGFVRVSLARGSGGSLVMAVEDSGIGVAKPELVSAFKAFTQGDNSPTRAYGGLGLGLTVAQGLADVIGAAIEYRPREGGGSVFAASVPGAFPPAAGPGAASGAGSGAAFGEARS